MKVNTGSYPFWPDGTSSDNRDNAHHLQSHAVPATIGHASNSHPPSRPLAKAGSSQNPDPRSPAKESGAPKAAAADGVDSEANAIATQAVLGNEIAADMETFNASLTAVGDDIEQGRDTTDDMIAAASAYDRVLQLSASDKPTPELQSKIDRLKTALQDSKANESLDAAAQKANVDLSALNHHADAASTYSRYGKAPSTYTRAFIFDEARFNNSVLLKNTRFAAWQRPGESILDPLGPNGRLGILTGTRLNAAASYFVKGGQSFLSGMEKLRKGQDPTKDFIAAAATIGQGINEVTVGVGTDVGNHLVKLRQAKAPQTAATAGRSTDPLDQSRRGGAPGAPEPVAGPSATEFADFDPHDKLDDEIDTREKQTVGHIDDELTQQQKNLRGNVIAKLETTNRDVQQLELQDATNDLAPQYFEMQHIANDINASTADAANDAHENIKMIDAKAQDAITRLKGLGCETADAARQSGNPEAIELARQLDQLGRLKQAAYDQFNSAMQNRETALSQARSAFDDLGKLLKDTPASERASKLKEWTDKYTTVFANRQANILSKTDSWPDWMKISKPLRMQMIPAAINTALGGVTFGVALDTYLKKQSAGTLTPQDRLDLAAAAVNLSSGMVGFVPVIGPALSFALATLGIVLGGLSDQYDARSRETDVYNLKEQIREEYNAKHPDAQIAEPFDGD